MHNWLKFALLIVITLSCFVTSGGQIKQNARQLDQENEHICRVIETLDKFNDLRMALENGARGDGIHHAWMDDMRKLGIKHVSHNFRFLWNQGVLTVDILKVFYRPKYYDYAIAITDTEGLKQIVDSGLKDKLEVEARMRASVVIRDLLDRLQPKALACGAVYVNLLDDEALPILDGMSQIDIDSNCTQK